MKKKLSSIDVILEKVDKKLIKGGTDNCNYYASLNIYFSGNYLNHIHCNQISNYFGAASCINIDSVCFDL